MPGLVQVAINAELFKEQLRGRKGGQHRPHSWTSCCMVPPSTLPGPNSAPPSVPRGIWWQPLPAPLQLAPGFLSLFSLTADSEKPPPFPPPVISVDLKQKQHLGSPPPQVFVVVFRIKKNMAFVCMCGVYAHVCSGVQTNARTQDRGQKTSGVLLYCTLRYSF